MKKTFRNIECNVTLAEFESLLWIYVENSVIINIIFSLLGKFIQAGKALLHMDKTNFCFPVQLTYYQPITCTQRKCRQRYSSLYYLIGPKHVTNI